MADRRRPDDDEPAEETFRTVIAGATEAEVIVAVAKHYAGPEHFVRVRRAGRATWAADVATAEEPSTG